MSRAIHGGIWLVIISAISVTLLIGYWLLWPYNVQTIHEVTVLNSPVVAGQYAMVQIKFDKHMGISCTISRELLDGTATPLNAPRVSNVPVGPGQWMLPIQIPDTILPGRGYQIHNTYHYQVNPIRTVQVEWITPEFEIVAPVEPTAQQKRILKNAIQDLIKEEAIK